MPIAPTRLSASIGRHKRSTNSDPLIDAILVLLDNAQGLCVEALTLLVVLLQELMERSTNHVLLLQLLAESNVIKGVTVVVASEESEAAHLLDRANTTQGLRCRRLLDYLVANGIVP